ncbi:MAG: hypothetical protein IJS70_10740 [Bacteroidales bacterium]|jgi:hypothetical protein|nr:hypothetical protein [Bacteroidales bacterium]MBQ7459633.1 hypothetical protein [Bacteroidales bacterium]
MYRLTYIYALALILVCSACTQTPPEEFLTPEFEEVMIDGINPDAIVFTCKMSSMSQLTTYGLDYTCDWEADDAVWTRLGGVQTGGDRFEVILKDPAPGTTYCYRLFIGNGRDVMQSAQNYYTTPE